MKDRLRRVAIDVRVETRPPMLWAALALSSGIRLGSVAGVQQCGWLAVGFFQFAASFFIRQHRYFAYSLAGLGHCGSRMRSRSNAPTAASGAEAIALFAEGGEVVISGQATREGELAVDNSFTGGHAIRICPGCRLPGKHFRTDLDSGVMSYLNRRR